MPGVARVAPGVAVSVRDLWFSYRDAAPILRGVTFDARAGEMTVILGESGGGKTTLLRILKGLVMPLRGEIEILSSPLKRGLMGRLDPRVAYIPQQLGLIRSQSVVTNVLTGALARTGTLRSLLGLMPVEHTEEAEAILHMLGIGEKAALPVQTLSGGERQRVAIARSLMQHPTVILADEFVSQLDIVTSREIMSLARDVADRGVALVMTTHELDLAREFADRVIVLRDGAVALDSPAREVDEAALVKAIRG
ncbi:MAG: ATP-binding cassette domain-containing protein [Dehalococcoidia bacterium]|nr:MAG: ATP-binding cassette domain-containing protein [Dehalococcoidia bacterium]